MLTYTIYKITDGQLTYVGMTVQPLKQRLNQHIMDAKSNGCSISKNLCKKKKPPDLKNFHFKLRWPTGQKLLLLVCWGESSLGCREA